jgi:hypothetical protein
MLSEAVYVTLIEYAIFLMTAGGLLQIHGEKRCAAYDAGELECLVPGPTYYAVAYGVCWLASAAAFGLVALAFLHAALAPGVRPELVERVALAGMHWQTAVSATLVAVLLAVWERPGPERRLYWAVLVRTGVAHVESEILTRLFILGSWLFALLFAGFGLVLYLMLARLAPPASCNLHSLALSALLLAMFMQHWLSAYHARVCENVSEHGCPPALAQIRPGWFQPDYDVAFTACVCLSFVALCDLASLKARSFYERRRESKPKYIIAFALSRAALDGVVGFTLGYMLSPDLSLLYTYSLVLWVLCALCSLYDCYQFHRLHDVAPRAPRPTQAFDIAASAKRIVLRRTDSAKKRL